MQAKISFSRQGSFQYFHFTEFKTEQDHISCFTSRDKFKLPIYQTCRHMDQNIIFATKSFQYFHFTEYKTKQAHISCFASRDKFKPPIYQTCRHIDQNRFFATQSLQYFQFTEYKTKYFRDKVVPILPFYQIQTKIGSHIMFRIQGQVQTSHLSNLQAYCPKSHFCVKDQSKTFILPNTNPNRFTYHVSHQGTLRNK